MLFIFIVCTGLFQGILYSHSFDSVGRLIIANEERAKLMHEKIILQMRSDYDRLVDDWECEIKQGQSNQAGWLYFVPVVMIIKLGIQLWESELTPEDMGTLIVTEGILWAAKKLQKIPPLQSEQKAICSDQRACKKLLNEFKANLIASKLELASIGLALSVEEKNLVSTLEKAASDFDAKIKACDVLNTVEKPAKLP